MRTRALRRTRVAALVGTFVLTGCSARDATSQSPLDTAGGPAGATEPAPAPAPTASGGPSGALPSTQDPSALDAPGGPDATGGNDANDADASVPDDASAVDAASGDDGGGSDAGVDAPPDLPIDCGDDPFDPLMLACTGLYGDWPSRTIANNVHAFAPGTPLWSDGADKSRYIYLPPGTQIDTTNFDEWQFPVGTKLWKEFRLNGQRIETRFLWKRDDGWFRTTYAWALDGTSAIELTTGQTNWNGTPYEIPDQDSCTLCHMGAADGVLGFEAVGLAEPSATGLTLSQLVAQGLLTQPPPGPIVVPGNPTESAALAWLHANCGLACHNSTPAADAYDQGMFLRLEIAQLGSVQSTDTWNTTVGMPSNFQPNSQSMMLLIAPGDLANSAIYFRDSHRDVPDSGTRYQMPPIDTHVVPTDGVALVAAWIQSIPPTASSPSASSTP